MEKKLKSLEEFNEERRYAYHREKENMGNGIACPRCGVEMYDAKGEGVMMSIPPQLRVICPSCEYRGNRIC